MSLVQRGTLINGEFVEGRFEYGKFVRTKYRRGAKGLLVLVPREEKKAARRGKRLAKVLEFQARPTYRPGVGWTTHPARSSAALE